MTATDRAEFQTRRDAGLGKRQQTRIAGRNQCHYCSHSGDRCTAEVADPLAEVALCTKHLARVVEYVTHLQARLANRSAS
jgi:hypothetical protein